MATRADLKTILAQQLGDALTSGSPAFHQGSGFKYTEPEYNTAINFAVELLRDMFLIPQESAVRFGVDLTIYEITPPSNMVYVTEMVRENEVDDGQYETPIPMDITTVRRVSGQPVFHLDRQTVINERLYLGSANVWFKGYQRQANPTADGDAVSINSYFLTQMAKLFLMSSSTSRDPAELLKSMRQAQETRTFLAQFQNDVVHIEDSGGIWLE